MPATIDQIESDITVEPESAPARENNTEARWVMREKVRDAQQRIARDYTRTCAGGIDA